MICMAQDLHDRLLSKRLHKTCKWWLKMCTKSARSLKICMITKDLQDHWRFACSFKICRITEDRQDHKQICMITHTYRLDHQHIGRISNKYAGSTTDLRDHKWSAGQDHQQIDRTTNTLAGQQTDLQDVQHRGMIDHKQICRITHDWQDHTRSAGSYNIGRITQYLYMTTQGDQHVTNDLQDHTHISAWSHTYLQDHQHIGMITNRLAGQPSRSHGACKITMDQEGNPGFSRLQGEHGYHPGSWRSPVIMMISRDQQGHRGSARSLGIKMVKMVTWFDTQWAWGSQWSARPSWISKTIMDHDCDFDDHIGGKTTSDQEDHQGQLISQVVMKTFRDHEDHDWQLLSQWIMRICMGSWR